MNVAKAEKKLRIIYAEIKALYGKYKVLRINKNTKSAADSEEEKFNDYVQCT